MLHSVGLSSMDAGRNQVKNSIAPVEPMVPRKSTGALDVLCSRVHVLVDFNFSSAPVEPTLQNQSTGALDVLCSRTLVLS